jgi:hypothetical protein
MAHGLKLDHIFRTDLGDDEGGAEWVYGRVLGTIHRRGEHDVEIVLPSTGGAREAEKHRRRRMTWPQDGENPLIGTAERSNMRCRHLTESKDCQCGKSRSRNSLPR